MPIRYCPLTQPDLDLIGELEGFSPPTWTGPALPRPTDAAGFDEIIDTFNKLVARAMYLIQVKDALSVEYTINQITATAERFMLGTEEQVQQAADIRGLLVLVESFLKRTGIATVTSDVIEAAFAKLHVKLEALLALYRPVVTVATTSVAAGTPGSPADYSAFALDDPSQFSMAWTTLDDAFRIGYPQVVNYVRAMVDPVEATQQFWPALSQYALPYNLLVLQKLTPATAEPFRTNFGAAWDQSWDDLLRKGQLYGIDMTIFAGLEPQSLANGTVRVTPSTMVLLQKVGPNFPPIAVYVADAMNAAESQVYTPASPAWIYSLLAAKTSLTVHGIWLGHVYTLHIVTAAMQMATFDHLPPEHIVYQLLAPQSHYTIPFDLILLLGWSHLSPPTSISDSGKFLTLCAKFSAAHDFFSTDPRTALTRLNLSAEDFTTPDHGNGQPWNLYPNVQWMLHVWDVTEAYVKAVVGERYPSDAAVADDPDLAEWISKASDANHGNVVGLPKMDSVQALTAVLTSVLYRIVFHGMGRLRSMGTPEPSFAPNYPPCLQSTKIPAALDVVGTPDLLKTYLPRTGTLGDLISFYDLFSHSAPYVPLVPNKGWEDELFFDPQRYPLSNRALIAFRAEIEQIIRTVQPDWAQIGQWPRNIEL